MKKYLDRAIEAIALARAPKEPPAPAGSPVGNDGVLERPGCPGCGNTRANPVLTTKDTWISTGGQDHRAKFGVVRCEICGLRYTTPRFSFEHRSKAFEGDYPFYQRAQAVREGKSPELSAEAWKPFLSRADALCELKPTMGHLLDIGCGDGYFADLMRARGWHVRGTDIQEDVAWHSQQVLGVPTQHLDVELSLSELAEGPYDAITLWGVAQLVYKPHRLLERLRDYLVPGGIIAIGVSNARSLGATGFRRAWRGWGVPRHVSHFSPEALRRLLEFTGYELAHQLYESPRWIVAGSADEALPKPANRLAKAALYPLSQLVDGTRYADTMAFYARKID